MWRKVIWERDHATVISISESLLRFATELKDLANTLYDNYLSIEEMHNLMKNVWYENCEPWITGLPA